MISLHGVQISNPEAPKRDQIVAKELDTGFGLPFNQGMRKLLFFLSLSFAALAAFPTSASSTLVHRWAVDLAKTSNVLQNYQQYQLGGATVDGKYFFISTPAGSLDRRLLQTGEIDWSTKLDGVSQATWSVYQGYVYGGDTRGNLYSIDAKTGSIKWKVKSKGMFFSRALVEGDKLWVMTSLGTLQCYDRETGQWQWQQTDPAAANTSLWSQQGPVLFQGLVISGFPSAILMALNPTSGQAQWTETFNSLPGGADSFNDLKAISADKEYLFASSFSGDLRGWQATQGSKKLLWQKRLSLHAPLTISGDIVYLSARDGSLQALDLKTGYVRWQYEFPKGLGTQPSIIGQNIWVGTTAGEVFVFTNSGKLLARSNPIQSTILQPIIGLSETEGLVLSSNALLRSFKLSEIFNEEARSLSYFFKKQ